MKYHFVLSTAKSWLTFTFTDHQNNKAISQKKRSKREKKFEVLSHVWLGQIRSIGILSLGITWGAGVRLDPPHQPVPTRAATAAPLLHCCPVHSGPNRAEPPPQFLVIWTNEMLLLMMLIVAIIIFQSHCVKTLVTLSEFQVRLKCSGCGF